MRSPGNNTGDGVMDSVVVNMDGHTKNIHGRVHWHDEKNAALSVTVPVEQVVVSACLDPFAIDLEIQRRQVVGALGLNNTLGVLPVFDTGVGEHLEDQIFVVERGDDKGS